MRLLGLGFREEVSRSGEGGTERKRLDDSSGKSRGGRYASKSKQVKAALSEYNNKKVRRVE